jgi:hypothetical protein
VANGEQWYMVIGGHQVGPVSADEIAANLKNGSIDSGTLVYTHGMENWAPLSSVPRFSSAPGGTPAAPMAPGRVSHEIDFQIFGSEMQFVEVELDPGESTIAEAGVLMYLTRGIEMETVFGDGTAASTQGGVMGALLGAGKRLLTGESLFMTVFTNRAQNRQRVAFAAPYAGKILPMDLGKLGGQLICQKDSFLCAAKGIGVEIASRSGWASACLEARASSSSASWETASPLSTRAAPSTRWTWRPARTCGWTPAASWPSSPPSPTTSNLWAR